MTRWADFLLLLEDGGLQLREMGKVLGKSKSTLQEVLSKRLKGEFVNRPVKGDHRGYKSARKVYTLTARGHEIAHRFGNEEIINRTSHDRDPANKPDKSRENPGPEYLSIHHVILRIPFLTPRPAKLPMMIIRTDETYNPGKLVKSKIDNWNYIKDHQVPIRIKEKDDPSWFPGITVHDKMSGWDWYTYQEEVEGERITTKVWMNGVEISIPEIIGSKDASAYDMIDLQLEKYIPYVLDLEEKLGRSFSRDLLDWQSKFKRLDTGMLAMSLTGEIAHVGDEFARVVWKNGKPGQRMMQWYDEDGKGRMHIDFSHPESPELELTGTGTFVKDSEALRQFRDEIGQKQYNELAREMDHREFGDMILEHADKKWSYKEERIRLRKNEGRVNQVEDLVEKAVNLTTQSYRNAEEELSDLRAIVKELAVTIGSALGMGGFQR